MNSDTDRRPGQRPSPERTAELKQAFLDDFRKRGIVMRSAEVVGVARRTIYDWTANDPEFRAAYEEACEDANDVVRAEIFRRGVEGFDEEHIVGGRKFTVRKYSDRMLQLLAQSRMSEFKERIDVTTAGSALVGHEAIAAAASDPQTTEYASKLLERLAGYAGPSDDAGGTGVPGE